MAHVSGLVAAGHYPSPIPFADVVTTTTHKTLRGPRGGLILAKENEDLHKKLNSAIFPGTQGGPLMHVIAAKAVCFKEALDPSFKIYTKQVIENAKTLSETLIKLNTSGADALFISCTALPALEIINKVEQKINKPVFSSNQTLIWDTIRSVGYKNEIQGYGQLKKKKKCFLIK